VLEVAGQHLVAGAQPEAAQHRVHALGRRVHQRDLVFVRADQRSEAVAHAPYKHRLLEAHIG
jgi:hypothetical protein